MRFAVRLITTATIPFRYDLVWNKVGTTGYLDADRRLLRRHEHILVFAPAGTTTYNPQMGDARPRRVDSRPRNGKRSLRDRGREESSFPRA